MTLPMEEAGTVCITVPLYVSHHSMLYSPSSISNILKFARFIGCGVNLSYPPESNVPVGIHALNGLSNGEYLINILITALQHPSKDVLWCSSLSLNINKEFNKHG